MAWLVVGVGHGRPLASLGAYLAWSPGGATVLAAQVWGAGRTGRAVCVGQRSQQCPCPSSGKPLVPVFRAPPGRVWLWPGRVDGHVRAVCVYVS